MDDVESNNNNVVNDNNRNLIRSRPQIVNPRNDTFHKFLKRTFFPNFQFLSFTFIITVVYILGYILLVSIYGLDNYTNGTLAVKKIGIIKFGCVVYFHKNRCLSIFRKVKYGDYLYFSSLIII